MLVQGMEKAPTKMLERATREKVEKFILDMV